MALSQLLPSVLWAFFGLSVAATGFLAYVTYRIIADDDISWQSTASMGPALLAAMGLMICSLVLLGQPGAALNLLRVFSVVICVQTLFFDFDSIRKSTRTSTSVTGIVLQVTAMTAVTMVTICFAVASFWVRALPYIDGRMLTGGEPFAAAQSSAGASNAGAPGALINFDGLGQLDFWHSMLYLLLIAVTAIFAVLFVRAMIEEGPLSMEKNWGGLGGSSGGWAVSSSLTYLVATIALSVLLISLIYHSDALHEAAEKRKEDGKAALTQPGASKTAAPADKPAASSPAGATPEANKPAPAGASAAGPHPDAHSGAQPGVQPDAH